MPTLEVNTKTILNEIILERFDGYANPISISKIALPEKIKLL